MEPEVGRTRADDQAMNLHDPNELLRLRGPLVRTVPGGHLLSVLQHGIKEPPPSPSALLVIRQVEATSRLRAKPGAKVLGIVGRQ